MEGVTPTGWAFCKWLLRKQGLVFTLRFGTLIDEGRNVYNGDRIGLMISNSSQMESFEMRPTDIKIASLPPRSCAL